MRKLIVSCLAATTAWSALALELIRDGEPLAEIVVAEQPNPSAKAAAGELRKYLKKMSGAELPIVTKPTGKTPIYVGRSSHTDKLGITLDDVKYDGFKIIVEDDYAAILGRDQCRPPIPRGNDRFSSSLRSELQENWRQRVGREWTRPSVRDPRDFCQKLGFHVKDATGTLHAVYHFLEGLGMRWFMPIEEIGQVIPRRRDVSVKPTRVKKEPSMASRYMAYRGAGVNPSETLWLKYVGLGGAFDMWPVHSSMWVARNHPDSRAIINGKPSHLPRLASPRLREELSEYLIQVGDDFPEMSRHLAIGQPDGWVALDDRDAAAGWDKKTEGNSGRFSDYVWDFVLDVAKRVRAKRPDFKFNTLAYGHAENPPKIVDEIPGDITVFLTQYSATWRNDDALVWRKDWLEKAPNSDFFIYDYYLFHRGKNPPIPAIFTANLAKNFKNTNAQFKGSLVEIAGAIRCDHNIHFRLPGINHLTYYLHGKLSWDKNLDVKATLEDYYDKFFGPAKNEMREFYEFAEEVWTRTESRQITAYSGFLKPTDVDRYFEILDRARKKAGDGVYGRRVDFIRNEMEPLKKLFSELKRTGPYVRVRGMNAVPEIDGDLSKPFWTDHFPKERTPLRDCAAGTSLKNNMTDVAFRWLPDNSLLVGITCRESDMDSLRADTPNSKRDDNSIYSDDNVELHLETPDGYNAVIVVNANGAVNDRCVTPNVTDVPHAWNVEQVASRKLPDRWTTEIKVKGLGSMPTKTYPWGVNVFRQRLADGKFEGQALSPTGGGFLNAPEKMGNLYGP